MKLKRSQISNHAFDDEWNELYDFQRSFRETYCVTAGDLLVHMHLPPSMVQYLYSNRSRPSKKPGSLGQKLRSGLADLRDNPSGQITPSQNLSFRIQEFFEANKTALRAIGVESLHLSDEGYLILGSTPTVRDVDASALKSELARAHLDLLEFKCNISRTWQYLRRLCVHGLRTDTALLRLF